MGSGGSKVDKVLEEKMRRRELALAGEEEEDEEKDLRRSNSLVLALEDYLEGKAQDVEPKPEEELANRRKGDEANSRELLADKLASIIAMGNLRALREEVIQHMATINRAFEGRLWQKDTMLHMAAREGYARMVEYETDPRSHSVYEITEVNTQPLNKKKRTPLHLAFTPPQATYCGRRFGVVNGVAQSEKPDNLESIVDWERPGGHDERHRCVVALVSNKASPNALDLMDYSVLHYACMLGWRDTVAFLLDRGADPKQLNVLGQNCLMLAIKYGNVEVVEHLLEHAHLPLDHRDSQGDTALIYAIQGRHVRITELVLDFGADPTMETYKKHSPLHLACKANHADLVSLLLDFQVPRDRAALDLLKGAVKDFIGQRIQAEEEAAAKKDEKKRLLQEAARRKALESGGQARDGKGQWVPYKDKRGRGVFYYNKVTRASQFDVPPDYVRDRTYVMKEATFGMSFYH